MHGLENFCSSLKGNSMKQVLSVGIAMAQGRESGERPKIPQRACPVVLATFSQTLPIIVHCMLQYSLTTACIKPVEIVSKPFRLYLHWLRK
jgi:hypothetical protein